MLKMGGFGTELVAMKRRVDALSRLRHRLRMMGVVIDGTKRAYWDDMPVINMSLIPCPLLNRRVV